MAADVGGVKAEAGASGRETMAKGIECFSDELDFDSASTTGL